MEEGSVVSLPRPGASIADDPLLAVLREGARRMLTQAIEAEVEAFLAAHAGLTDEQGRRRLVRNGHAPERQLQTGIGPLEVRRPKVRDRGVAGEGPIRFTSAILPAYLRRAKNLEELLPWLYLKRVSTGRFGEALAALLGPDAPLPASLQGKAKQDLHAIYEAENRQEAGEALDRFVAKYGTKYDKAAACLAKDRESLLAFYDFPAEHWKHVRTSNPIESTFATVRLRTDKTKGCLSRRTALAMVFKLTKSAERHWRRLDGSERLAQVIEGVRFHDGEPVHAAEEQAAA